MAQANETFQHKVAFILEDLTTSIGRWLNLTIAGLILVSCTCFVIETYPLSTRWQHILTIVDLTILTLFSGEYLLRLWCAENKLKFCLSVYAWIDLVAILPFFLGFLDIRFI